MKQTLTRNRILSERIYIVAKALDDLDLNLPQVGQRQDLKPVFCKFETRAYAAWSSLVDDGLAMEVDPPEQEARSKLTHGKYFDLRPIAWHYLKVLAGIETIMQPRIPFDKMVTPGVGTHWEHYKGGLYVVHGVKLREETNEMSVDYHSLQTDVGWNRAIRWWYQWVPNYGPRFLPVGVERSLFNDKPEEALRDFIENLPITATTLPP